MSTSYLVESSFSDSLNRLLLTKPLKKITVTEICADAGLSRRAFYNHFKDICDLAFWRYSQQANEELNGFAEHKDWEILTCNLYRYLLEERVFYTRLLRDTSQNSFINTFIGYSRLCFLKAISLSPNADITDDLIFAVNFYIYGTACTLVEWMENGMVEPPEVMSRRMINNIPKILRQYLLPNRNALEPLPQSGDSKPSDT